MIPAGPAIGGVLYAYGGFILPFAVTGGLLLGAIPILYIISSRLEKSLNELAEAQGTDSLGQDPPKIKDAGLPNAHLFCEEYDLKAAP